MWGDKLWHVFTVKRPGELLRHWVSQLLLLLVLQVVPLA